MRRINLLSENTANKIAAGEVVERASSVVKELVENSLDADSKNITIEIEDSGNKLIRITDDGRGIHPEDIKIAFLPHGTSKISSVEDIYDIQSFGFRGEALASIAAVSKVRLKSRMEAFDYGREIYIEGGKVIYEKDVGCNLGTEIEVKDLFFNTPGRQKFLKSPQREKSIINDLVLKLALGNYKTSITLINDGKQTLRTFSEDELDKTLRILYGKEVYENVIPIENHSDILSVYGYIGKESISRGSRNRQSIFVNKRLIKSSLITAAVENAFKSFIMVNKFPFFVIHIDIFPEFIDPNVHPTKNEVKFLEERVLFKTIFDGVHSALKESLKKSFIIPEEIEDLAIVQEDKLHKSYTSSEPSQIGYLNDNHYTSEDNNLGYNKDLGFNKEVNYNDKPSYIREIPIENQVEPKGDNIYYNKEISRIPKIPPIKLIGQCFNSYIIGEYLDELYLIDQHAAHEKILFEKYRKNIGNFNVVSQILAVPTIIPLTFDEYAIYKDNEEIFLNAGFMVESFGENDVLVREVPVFLGKPHINNLFHDMIENIKSMGSGLTIDIKYDKIASLACKAAVKANDKLSDVEILSLLEELRYIDEPFTCPHGRPTIIKYSLKEIEKSFKRI
ncbi:DNA mismatch repair protein MutL [Clostridium sulfidigenes]|uniref:DNA mismatch repair protein MutL n=1 Tax=Clostridium sulfidigenes TaxID=318464 RepID=A0A084JCS1_9CLOT|nr:DNA mismatch repair endonuclease MutL [Clostridium sulfidigenes]KEZ86755.1 DNA mismatch repair protein MutL [Clostridium sulfidigenes]